MKKEKVEFPKKWVVKKDTKNPLWEKFNHFWTNYSHKTKEKHKYFSSAVRTSKKIADFEGFEEITLEQWAEYYLPDENDKNVIDFSILKGNENEWFFIKTKGGYCCLYKGANLDDILLKRTAVYHIKKKVLQIDRRGSLIKDVAEIRFATEFEKHELYNAYPEYMNVKSGDSGLCYDGLKSVINDLRRGTVNIHVLHTIYSRDDLPFGAKNLFNYQYFYKIDMNAPLQPQIDEFLRKYDN